MEGIKGSSRTEPRSSSRLLPAWARLPLPLPLRPHLRAPHACGVVPRGRRGALPAEARGGGGAGGGGLCRWAVRRANEMPGGAGPRGGSANRRRRPRINYRGGRDGQVLCGAAER